VTALRNLRIVAFLEGISFLLLLLVAMPLKYGLGLAIAVKIAGSLHGLLFLLFLTALFRVATERSWPLRRSLGAFVASLLPGGTFVLDRVLVREIEAGRLSGQGAPARI
jgi:integral membrane protein